MSRAPRNPVRARALLLALVVFSVSETSAPADVPREDLLKAGYLFNFLKFVEWPAGVANRELTICFMGGGGIHAALTAGIESKKVGNRSVVARQLEPAASLEGCNALYLGAELVSVERYLPLAGKFPVLTVSDAQGFARAGGMIELFTQSNRLRFNVNLGTAQKAGLSISSNLLQLAAAIEKGEGK